METSPSTHHKKPLVPPKKVTVFSGDCCRLSKGELPLQELPVATAVAAEECGHHSLPAHRRKPGHPGASPGLLTQYLGIAHHLQHQLLGQGYGEGLQSEQTHDGGFWAHRAYLLGTLLQVNSIKINNNSNKRIQFCIFSCCPCSAIVHNTKYDEVPTSEHGLPF